MKINVAETKYKIIFSVLSIFICSYALNCGKLPNRLLVGYWQNWSNGQGFKLAEIPDSYDVINIAFAMPEAPYDYNMQFKPDRGIYAKENEFISDLKSIQKNGKKVLISIGGATCEVSLQSKTDINKFVKSMKAIIDKYGFDGIDVNLENRSLLLEEGDIDFRRPKSKPIINFIKAIKTLLNYYGEEFIVAAAPETAFVQGAFGKCEGTRGAYLPFLHAFRDRLDLIYVQHYNTGSMYGRDGRVYEPASPDFHSAMADALISGFTVNKFGKKIFFPGFPQEKILIGIPASEKASSGVYTPPETLALALDYIIKGSPYGGVYRINNSEGYFNFRGIMTWSINYDRQIGYSFSGFFRNYFDELDNKNEINIPAAQYEESGIIKIRPNPFISSAKISLSLPFEGYVRLEIIAESGEIVATLLDEYISRQRAVADWSPEILSPGVYICRLRINDKTIALNAIRKAASGD